MKETKCSDERQADFAPVESLVRPVPFGTKTVWGKVQAVGITGGERYYWVVAQDGSVAMMPAFVVEKAV